MNLREAVFGRRAVREFTEEPVQEQVLRRPPPQRTEDEPSRRRDHRKGAPVSWYGKLLIVGLLLVAVGWEIFRLILTIITLD